MDRVDYLLMPHTLLYLLWLYLLWLYLLWLYLLVPLPMQHPLLAQRVLLT